MPRVVLGATLLVAAGLFATIETLLLRFMPGASISQVLLVRGLAQVLVMGAIIGATGGVTLLRTRRIGLHLLRGVISAVSWWLYYASFLLVDLALATTLTFSSQIFLLILATIFLGEKLTAVRIGATVFGLLGIMVATRVWNVAAIDPNVAYGLSGALLGAVVVILTSALSRTERTTTIMFYIGVVVTLAAVPQAALDWRPLSGRDLALMLTMSVLGIGSMWLMVEAYRYAEASVLAPFPYLRLIFSAAAGYFILGETIHDETYIGAILIIASALMVIYESTRNRKRRQEKARGEDPSGPEG